MNPIERLITAFGEAKNKTIVENFERFYAVYELRDPTSSEDINASLLSALNELGTFGIQVFLTLKIDSYNPIRINSNSLEKISERLQEYDDIKGSLEHHEFFELAIEIDKSSQKNLNIFSCTTFFSIGNNTSLITTLSQWSKCLSKKSHEIFLWDEINGFSTKNLEFTHYSLADKEKNPSNSKKIRSQRIELRDKCCHFANASEIRLIPQDFMLCENVDSLEVSRSFALLANALCICFLSDHSTISENQINYRVNGYKVITENLDSAQIECINQKELSEVYEWVYGGGDISDKIGIARNIISIHAGGNCFLDLESGTTKSIRSGYELYLKENVKQYIEIKNKIADFLHSQSDKSSDLTKNMFNMFKSNIWTFSTFFIGVFLLRALNKTPEGSAFNFEVLIVSYLLLAVSFIYLAISVSELNTDRDRLLNQYDSIKQRYNNLLDKKDLEQILNVDELKNKDIAYIDKKRNKYIASWIIINLLLGLFVTFLYLKGAPNVASVEEEPKQATKLEALFDQKTPSGRESIQAQEPQPKENLNLKTPPY